MIKVNSWGRFGNQLFQYAFAYATSKKLKTLFFMVPFSKFVLPEYFELDPFTRFFFNRRIVNFYGKCLWKIINKNRVENIDNYDQIPILNQTHYTAFFQDETYFKNYKADILKKFSIKKKWLSLFEEKYGDTFNMHKTIVIHVRRSDYLDLDGPEFGGKNPSLPITYYDRCLALIDDLENYKVFCISDDLDYVKKHYSNRSNFFFESNDLIVDFQLLLKAEILIIANSSFSWWGAYLNKRADKSVFAPKYWLGYKVKREYPKGIMSVPYKWTDVN